MLHVYKHRDNLDERNQYLKKCKKKMNFAIKFCKKSQMTCYPDIETSTFDIRLNVFTCFHHHHTYPMKQHQQFHAVYLHVVQLTVHQNHPENFNYKVSKVIVLIKIIIDKLLFHCLKKQMGLTWHESAPPLSKPAHNIFLDIINDMFR